MKKIFDALFSMHLTVVLLLMFALSAAMATFIENDYGTIAARVAVYEATWFEILLALLVINLAGSLVIHHSWRRKKYALFMFHLAFIIIFVGAGITRFFSYEGMMHIREGETSSEITSTSTFLTATYQSGGETFYEQQHVLMSPYDRKAPNFKLNTPDGNFKIETIGYIANANLEVVPVKGGNPIASLFVMSGMQRETITLSSGEVRQVGNMQMSFDSGEMLAGELQLMFDGSRLMFQAADTIFITNMGSEVSGYILPHQKAEMQPMQLYDLGKSRIVLRSFEPSGTLQPVPVSNQMQLATGLDAVMLRISSGNSTVSTWVTGNRGVQGKADPVEIDGKTLQIAYGAITIPIPFALQLNEFILDRYPGSNSPSSYASEVTLIDTERDNRFDFRIFMNHILNYRGYRFYQSSYDTDEQGTVLSVNHDGLGTIVTYIGYFLMALGMLMALISKRSRFGYLLNKITETRRKKMNLLQVILLMLMITTAMSATSQEMTDVNGTQVPVIDREHAKKFGELIVLGPGNRLEPVNSLTGQLTRKFTGSTNFAGLTSDQIVLGIITDPALWQTVPLLKTTNKELREQLGISGKYASFSDFFQDGKTTNYLMSQWVETAYQKKSMDQTKFDKEVIKMDEKVNIFYFIHTYNYLKLFPKTTDPADKWFAPNEEVTGMPADDSNFVRNVIPLYANTLAEALTSGNYATPNDIVDDIDIYQRKYAGDLLPSDMHRRIEIIYNKVEIFERLFRYYGLVGLIFLLVLFAKLVTPKLKINFFKNVLIGILAVMYLFQTLGIVARWYISGHAPLSNGYESMIFIAWATMTGGFLLSRRSNIALAATTVLASLTLFVAHLNWMNPEVTNLVPVLKSIWLTIHVAIITSSYGFLGLGMILGLFNLLLMIFQNRNNLVSFNLTIREISLTAEATIIIGLYMLTIGTFLGGVWANESWGRYWGWDPKETWALITILVYAVIVHLNFIPGIMGRYVFNALAVVGFSSVLMTYFGVNYYLSGLHSYAAGDPVPIPAFVYYTIAILLVILIFAYIKNSKTKTLIRTLQREGNQETGMEENR
ncbi:MAG TPA: cytochrome c biogenesis protein CcsA [Bacteroidales bacterium]|nr:cytochrome c biogenesis protein CcsA [Bacteroidales bacterium]